MIRPTRRAVLLFALGVPLALVMVIAAPGLWKLSFDYGALVLLAIGSDAFLAFPRRQLLATVEPPKTLYVGERRSVSVGLTAAPHPRPTRFELMLEQRGSLDRPEILAVDLLPGGPAEAELPLRANRRGRVSIDRLWLRWQGPFALVEFVQRQAIDRSIDVLPNVRGVQSAALQFFAREAIAGVKVQQEKGEGTEFDALREWAPGLDHRFMDWKHSARHRRLLSKEFKTESNHPVVLAFDTGYLMCEPMDGISRLDHAINAGLLLAWISLRGGDLVGIYGFDASIRKYLRPIAGLANYGRIQRATAELAYHHQETNFTLGLAELNLRLRRRVLVVLFTDFVDTVTAELLIESMQRVAARHAVIFVTLTDPLLRAAAETAPDRFEQVAEAVVAQDLMRDRRVVFERLARLGIHCLDVPSAGLSVGLINRYLMVKQRGLI
jgi:uncharacterized protein (DUF58 family)